MVLRPRARRRRLRDRPRSASGRPRGLDPRRCSRCGTQQTRRLADRALGDRGARRGAPGVLVEPSSRAGGRDPSVVLRHRRRGGGQECGRVLLRLHLRTALGHRARDARRAARPLGRACRSRLGGAPGRRRHVRRRGGAAARARRGDHRPDLRPMRILMTADTVGGVWTYALELADALSPLGAEVHLATMGRPLDEAQRDQVACSSVVSVHESCFALEWQDEPWEDVDRAGAWLLELESEVMPDVVHLNGYIHGCLPWRTPVIVVAHSDVLSWWEAVEQVAAPPVWEPYRAGVQAGLRAADAVCAPTQAVLDDLARHYSFGTPAFVVHNGR